MFVDITSSSKNRGPTRQNTSASAPGSRKGVVEQSASLFDVPVNTAQTGTFAAIPANTRPTASPASTVNHELVHEPKVASGFSFASPAKAASERSVSFPGDQKSNGGIYNSYNNPYEPHEQPIQDAPIRVAAFVMPDETASSNKWKYFSASLAAGLVIAATSYFGLTTPGNALNPPPVLVQATASATAGTAQTLLHSGMSSLQVNHTYIVAPVPGGRVLEYAGDDLVTQPEDTAGEPDNAAIADDDHSTSQQWTLVENEAGSYCLVSADSKQPLHVGGEESWYPVMLADNEFLLLSAHDFSQALACPQESPLELRKLSLEDPEQKLCVYDITSMRSRTASLARDNASTVAAETWALSPAAPGHQEDFVAASPDKSVKMGSRSTSAYRTWELSVDGSGYVTLSNPAAGGTLAVQGDAMTDAAIVIQAPSSALTQKWIAVKGAEEGSFALMSAAWEGLYLDLGTLDSFQSATLQLRDDSRNQTWMLSEDTVEVANGSLAQYLADIASAEYKSGEDSGSHNSGGQKYWSAFKDRYEPWAAEFAGWCLREAGLVPGKTMPQDPTYSQAYEEFYKAHPEYATMHAVAGYVPQVGDIELATEGSNIPERTSIVVEVQSDCYYVVTGDADDVTKRQRKSFASPEVYCYITPDWTAATST